MKKSIILLACLALWFCKKDDSFTLNITLINEKPCKIYLEKPENDTYIVIDSAEGSNPTVTFSGKLSHPDVYFLKITGRKKSIPIFLEPGTHSINIEVDTLVTIPTVTGTPYHDLFTRYLESSASFSNSFDSLYTEYRKLTDAKNDSAAKEVVKQIDELENLRAEFVKQFVQTHKNIVGLYIIHRFLVYTMDYQELKKTLEGFNKELYPSSIYRFLSERLLTLEKTMIGKPAPEFKMENPKGKVISLSDYRGKYLLLDFWASWCGPCRKANPHVVELYNQYRNENFAILGVSLDNNREKWLAAIEADKLTWDHVSDLQGWKNAAAKLYGVNSIPRMFLIDPNGIIVANWLNHEDLNKKLAEIFYDNHARNPLSATHSAQ